MRTLHQMLTTALLLFFAQAAFTQAMDSLKTQRDSLRKVRKNIQKELGSVDKSLDSLKKEIEILSGWRVDGSSVVGLNFSRTNNWVSNANPNALTSSLSVAGNFSALKNNRKSFWQNNSTLNLAWQSLEIDTDTGNGAGFLEDRTTDVFTFSTLYGFNFSKDLALSALGDINTSLFDFLDSGSLGISAGVSWKPRRVGNLVVIGHFLSYNVAFSQNAAGESGNDAALGAKCRVSYSETLPLKLKWTSNLNTFIPYQGPEEQEASLFEYTWINNFAMKFWKSFGLGVNVGVRRANFETVDTQWFSTVGVSMTL